MATDSQLDENWRRDAPTARGLKFDALLAGVMLFGTAISVLLYSSSGFYSEHAELWITVLFVVAISAPLAARRRVPEAVALLIAVVFIVGQLLLVPELLFSNISLFIAIYSIGAWGRRRRVALVERAIIVVGMFAWLFVAFVLGSSGAPPGDGPGGILPPIVAVNLISLITNLLYFGGAWYFGDRAWIAARERAALESRTAELAAERALTAQQAVAKERIRIARELHDVVAHHVSVMGVQAGAARRVLVSNPDQATASLGAIEASARQAVDELHRMLTTLRDDDSTPSAIDSPSTHTIDQIDDLIDQAEKSGVPITFTTVGETRAVPGTVGVTVYRIVQESITNTLKHASTGTAIDVRLRYLDGSVEIEVTDNGLGGSGIGGSRVGGALAGGSGIAGALAGGSRVGGPGIGQASVRDRVSAFGGSGLGHAGMRERVSAVGGHIDIGPRPRGGYLVRAKLPTGETARDTSHTTPISSAGARA